MTLHGLIRKLQVDELVLLESLTAEMLAGGPRGPGHVKKVEKVKMEDNLPRKRTRCTGRQEASKTASEKAQ